MSIQQNFPAISPSLNLNFARSKTLDPRITFSRTSTATRVNELGLIETVDADVARFDHKYENGVVKSLGLLVEESRSNLFNHTEDFTQLPVTGAQDGWFKGRVDITTESITAPDGSSGVSLLTENANLGEHYVSQTGFNYTSGVTYTWSWYVKPNGRDNVYCKVYTNFNNTQVILNLETSSEYYLTGTTFDNITNTKLPNGWYRVSFTSTAISTGDGSVLLGFAQSTTVRSYTGDGSSGMYYWGAQVEAGAFPTSYIPNGTDSQATRTPDKVSMEGDNFSDWYNQSEGTFYSQFKGESRAGSSGYVSKIVYSISDGSFNNSHYAVTPENNGDMYWHSVSSGAGQGALGITPLQPFASNVVYKSAYAIKTNDRALSINGYIDTDSTTTLPVVNRLYIGSSWTGSSIYLGGHISQLTYYPRRLSNDNLQNLTK